MIPKSQLCGNDIRSAAYPSQKLNLGANHVNLVPLRERGQELERRKKEADTKATRAKHE